MWARLIFCAFWILSSWKYSAQQEEIQRFIYSEEFTPDKFKKKLSGSQFQSSALPLFLAYDAKLSGKGSEYFRLIEALIPTPATFESNGFSNYFYHLQLASYYCDKGLLINAKSQAEIGSKIADRNHEKVWQASVYAQMGKIYAKAEKKDSCFMYHKKSIEFAKRSEGFIILARCLHDYAVSSAHFSQIEQAVEQELLALQLVQKIKNDYFTSLFYQFIAQLSLDADNIRESENYLLKSNQKNKSAKNQIISLENDILHARLELRKELPAEALKILPSTIQNMEKLQVDVALGEAWMVLGQAQSAQYNSAQATEAFTKALVYFEQQILPKKMAEVYYYLGKNNLSANQLVEAEKNLIRSVNIQNNIGDTKGLHENYFVLSQVYSRMGNPNLAFNFLNRYTKYLKKTTFSVDSKAIEELTQTNTREERERLIDTQEEELSKELKEKEILQLQSDRQLLGIVIVVVVFFLSGITLFFVNRQRNTLQEQRETEMQQSLLRSQMNPHFIFNALAVIQSYIYENTPEKTSSFLVNFSRLIRLILENSPKEFITIDIEKEILTKYLITQKLRFEDRFNFELHIDEELLSRKALIPPMITQPFVENSIEHGQLHTITNGLIQIHMRTKDGMLEIEVSDNGVGREKAAQIKKQTSHKSMAMDITRERIRIMNKKYKGKGGMEVSDFDTELKSGTKVIICLPLIYENTTFGKNEKSSNH